MKSVFVETRGYDRGIVKVSLTETAERLEMVVAHTDKSDWEERLYMRGMLRG